MSETEKRLVRYLDEHASMIKLTVDGNGEILRANLFAERVAGRSLSGTQLRDFFTDFNSGVEIDDLLQNEVTKVLLNVNTFRNLPETLYFSSFKTDKGVVLLGEMNSDEAEEMRATMISLNNELNNLTRELNKQNVQLDQLNQLKNQFLGMAAHDLRNPIASIIMFSELVLDSDSDEFKLSEELRSILDVIRNSSEFMLRLLDELLDVVKIESGKLQLNHERVQPESLLKKNIQINSLLAAKKEIRLLLNIPAPLPEVSLDPVKIEQVLNNLISNAIKYSHRDKAVTVSALSTDRQLLISIKDEGQGIPEEEISKLFIPFSKISVKGTEGEKSTGLGLSIVKRIVTGHGGRIWVESEVGRGSTFYFTIPMKE